MAKTLIVMRHAKSSWQTADPDHDRPLAHRGVRDGVVAGQVLAGYRIDRVLSSTATRTRETWRTVAMAGADCADVRFLDELYHAWPRDVIATLADLDEGVTTAMVLGHEPTMSELIDELARPSELADRATTRFPTCAIAVLEVPGPWRDLGPGVADLVRFEVPRG